MTFSGKAPDYPIMQVLELPQATHPYFIATQAHSELTSRPLRPDPLFLGLVRAAQARAHGSATIQSNAGGRISPASHTDTPNSA